MGIKFSQPEPAHLSKTIGETSKLLNMRKSEGAKYYTSPIVIGDTNYYYSHNNEYVKIDSAVYLVRAHKCFRENGANMVYVKTGKILPKIDVSGWSLGECKSFGKFKCVKQMGPNVFAIIFPSLICIYSAPNIINLTALGPFIIVKNNDANNTYYIGEDYNLVSVTAGEIIRPNILIRPSDNISGLANYIGRVCDFKTCRVIGFKNKDAVLYHHVYALSDKDAFIYANGGVYGVLF